MAKHSSQILELARKGAEVKYQELQAEVAALVKHFPHLRKGGVRNAKASSAMPNNETASVTPRRRKRIKMSAAAKNTVSLSDEEVLGAAPRSGSQEIDIHHDRSSLELLRSYVNFPNPLL